MDLAQLATARALRIDPPRNEPKVTITVESRCDGHVVAGIRVPVGKSTHEVYASDVALFRGDVEDADMRGPRERLATYEDALARKKRGEIVPDEALPRGTPSLESCFRQHYLRDMRPFVSVKVEAPEAQATKGKA